MRNVLCCALLLPVMALAAASTRPVTSLVPESGAMGVSPSSATAMVDPRQPNVPMKALVGSLDTIGGTTYDWVCNGPRLRVIVNSPTYGVHVAWMYSTTTSGTDFPDRNMRYNFYDITTHAWNWLDADYMQSGVNVYGKRAGHGNLDADPSSGIAVVGAHVAVGSDIRPLVARDAAPGAGIFEYADSMALGVCQWAPVAVNQDGRINIFPITAAYDLSYSNIAVGSWPSFSNPQSGFDPSPLFPTHNITASKVSDKVALTWSINVTSGIEDGYVDFSTDGGTSWGGPTLLELPPAYGGDTVTSCHITSLFPWYDAQDKFHIVANLMPMVRDTGYIIPSQVWHYSADNDPQWSRIAVASIDPANFLYSPGMNATLACRPTIGQDDDANLFVAWEQFDTLNYEPTTSRARADIWASRSTDNGATWGEPLKLTDAGTHSMRFPCVIDRAVEGDPDTMYVLYEDDSVAGFYVTTTGSPEGPATPNPIVVQRVVVTDLPAAPGAVAEQRLLTLTRLDAAASPNPFGGRTQISYSVPMAGDVSLAIYDAAGRPVQTLASGRREPGRYAATWDAKNVAAGVYFFKLTSDKASITRKLILAD
jgi:hypothetical protein